MKIEQLNRAKAIQACIEAEERNVEHMERLGKCKELIIINNNEEIQRAIKGIYFSTNDPAPRYATSEDIKILVDALNKPRIEKTAKLWEEFDNL